MGLNPHDTKRLTNAGAHTGDGGISSVDEPANQLIWRALTKNDVRKQRILNGPFVVIDDVNKDFGLFYGVSLQDMYGNHSVSQRMGHDIPAAMLKDYHLNTEVVPTPPPYSDEYPRYIRKTTLRHGGQE